MTTATNSNNPTIRKRFKLKLFWKILGWFWLTIVVLITLFSFIAYINSGKVHFRVLPPPIMMELENATVKAQNYFNRTETRQGRSKRRMREVFILNSQGEEYLGRPVPAILSELHSRVQRADRPLTAFRKQEAFVGGLPLQIQGEPYRLYMQQRSRMFSVHLVRSFFRDITKTLLFAVFVISFPVSFLLSWVITKPIRQFQLATQEIKANLANRSNLVKLNNRSDEFGELAQDFEDMANHLSRLLSSQKQLVSDVSHELRSPLSRLKIALGLMEKNSQDKNIERIKLEARRMEDMLENILTLSRLDADEIDTQKEPCDLSKIVQSVINDAQFEASEASINIKSQILPNCDLRGVQEALYSGIENIIRNAVRYTGQGGTITITLENTDDHYLLTVADSGPGVPEDELDSLFEPFYRAEFARTRETGGVGLGLSIAKRAFALNGGTITAKNIEPHGLAILVYFKTT
ncbi:HAMP domain-containing protein [Aliikangiella marina]|uniref:histidine kinase n=1 Tax=Aliikangiella marina TaxID=1712262 RepID=A0A545T940_9GAMM|nr:ATP-binding protein [Aliikangiella marina]TQV73734.1 HAMP domain-containing protein [Aliikangiella marina]